MLIIHSIQLPNTLVDDWSGQQLAVISSITTHSIKFTTKYSRHWIHSLWTLISECFIIEVYQGWFGCTLHGNKKRIFTDLSTNMRFAVSSSSLPSVFMFAMQCIRRQCSIHSHQSHRRSERTRIDRSCACPTRRLAGAIRAYIHSFVCIVLCVQSQFNWLWLVDSSRETPPPHAVDHTVQPVACTAADAWDGA